MPDAVPQHCPAPRELDDLELLVTGALAPLRGFDEPGSPVRLDLPPGLADRPEVELVDPEGLPLARVRRGPDASWAVEPLAAAAFGPFRRFHLSPAEVRSAHAGRAVVPVVDALTTTQTDRLRDLGPAVLVVLCGTGLSRLSPVALLRATLAATEGLDVVVVAAPLPTHDDPATDRRLAEQVVATYAGDDPVEVLPAGGDLAAPVARVVEHDQPPADRRGLVLFFTGLSGSGKSTLARALMDRLLEAGDRTVTSLDGDVVRRHLSAGLTFSAEDRETNIRRIGWVAAEISRHGGVAVCSPIAPFDRTRRQVRAMVDDAGGSFFLVHVATPLEECERRDRKGLYAKARRGEIPEFTGISSPYEEPDDADVRVDTTGRTIDDALADVVTALGERGLLRPGTGSTTDDAPLRVLFVCTANICRSPYMERRAGVLAGGRLVTASAGTHAVGGHAMDEAMAAALTARGGDPAGFASRAVTPAMVEEADLVLTAEAAHRTHLLEDHPGAFRRVFTLGQLAHAVERADGGRHGRALLEELGRHRATADPALDVDDPYRRGPEAAEAAAERIDGLLAAVLPRLVPAST